MYQDQRASYLVIQLHWHSLPLTPHNALSLVMKRKHYTKLVTCVTVVTIVSMFSAMVTDLHQYWRRDNNQLVSVGSGGENSQ